MPTGHRGQHRYSFTVSLHERIIAEIDKLAGREEDGNKSRVVERLLKLGLDGIED